LMAHLRLTIGDTISLNRVVDFSARNYVSSTTQNQIVLGFTIDNSKNIIILGAGPGLNGFGLTGLAVPQVIVYNASGTNIYNNAGIGAGANLTAFRAHYGSWVQSTDTGLLIVGLAAGSYTVSLTNLNPGTSADGIGLLDIAEQ